MQNKTITQALEIEPPRAKFPRESANKKPKTKVPVVKYNRSPVIDSI